MPDRRIALVTGANKGIGLATARQLAENGLLVLLGSRDPDRGARAAADLGAEGITVHPIVIDVTNDASVQHAADYIAGEFGRLDSLVNNAGVLIRKHALEVSAADARPEFDTNVFGTIRVIHAMLPLLCKSATPRIINVSSGSATFANTTDTDTMFARSHESLIYSATKVAVNMLTVKYANAFRDNPETSHIKINAVTPGYVATDLNAFKGVRSTEQGAQAAVYWATIGADGASGGFFDDRGSVAW
jgi:NAD(P)-dependent dehydrogenase (short-subunit alcohol dehydrogenase family)